MKTRILNQAQQLFFQQGFSKVSMDELARELGASKKTIYVHFPSKEALVRAVVVRLGTEMESRLKAALRDEEGDFLERMLGAVNFMGERLRLASPRFLRDVQRHAPAIWQEIEARRSRIIREHFSQLIIRGMKQKIFRNDINPQLFVTIHLTLVQNLLTPEALASLPYTIGEVFETIIHVLFEGIMTNKARSRPLPKLAALCNADSTMVGTGRSNPAFWPEGATHENNSDKAKRTNRRRVVRH